uniref:hypothetical protein n=1 Tax=Pseudoclavibacter soli TaxID=452623 RepID=UPI00055EFD20
MKSAEDLLFSPEVPADGGAGGRLGLWAAASERFVEGVQGDVVALTASADATRVFGTVELPALLENPAITSINGLTLDQVEAAGDSLARFELVSTAAEDYMPPATANDVSSHAAGEQYTAALNSEKFSPDLSIPESIRHADDTSGATNPTPDPDVQAPGEGNAGSDTDPSHQTDAGSNSSSDAEQVREHVSSSSEKFNKIATDLADDIANVNNGADSPLKYIIKDESGHIALNTGHPDLQWVSTESSFIREHAAAIRGFGGAFGVITTVADAYSYAQEFQAAYQRGDIAGAAHVVNSFSGEQLGGIIGGAAVTSLLFAGLATAGIAATGPVGLLVALTGGLIGGYLGAETIGALFTDAFDGISSLFLDGDADGVPDWLDPDGVFYNPPVSPLVLDLDGDGLDVIDLDDSSAHFDLNSNGLAEATAWITPDDAFLARDVNGNGKIDDLAELFGGQTTDGFTALSQYDVNGDRVIDSNDDIYDELRLWRDADGDGETDQGELTTLADADIERIDLDAQQINEDVTGSTISHRSTYVTSDGTVHRVDDIWFENNQALTVDRSGLSVDPNVEDLPDVRGYGNVRDLWTELSTRPDLQASLRQLVLDSSHQTAVQTREALESFVLDWAGVSGATPQSRGPYIAADHLAFLEQVHGQPFRASGGGANPGPNAGAQLESLYQETVSTFISKIAVQLPASAVALTGDPSVFQSEAYASLFGFSYDAATDSIRVIPEVVLVSAIGNVSADDPDSIIRAASLLDTWHELGLATAEHNPLVQIALQLQEQRTSTYQVIETLSLVPAYGVVTGTAEADHITETSHPAFVIANADDDVILTSASADHVFAGAGDDTITTNAGDDTIDAGTGDDTINAGAGSDTITGGAGADTIEGGYGSDRFLWARGDGNDTISESWSNSADVDRLVLSDVTPDQVSIRAGKTTNGLVLVIAETTPGAGDGAEITLPYAL